MPQLYRVTGGDLVEHLTPVGDGAVGQVVPLLERRSTGGDPALGRRRTIVHRFPGGTKQPARSQRSQGVSLEHVESWHSQSCSQAGYLSSSANPPAGPCERPYV